MVRKKTFGQTTKIWYEEMPSPEFMLTLIDAIEMARLQKDLLKEDMLYFYMIELLRNPEDLKKMTGSMLEDRLKIHYRRLEKDSLNLVKI